MSSFDILVFFYQIKEREEYLVDFGLYACIISPGFGPGSGSAFGFWVGSGSVKKDNGSETLEKTTMICAVFGCGNFKHHNICWYGCNSRVPGPLPIRSGHGGLWKRSAAESEKRHQKPAKFIAFPSVLDYWSLMYAKTHQIHRFPISIEQLITYVLKSSSNSIWSKIQVMIYSLRDIAKKGSKYGLVLFIDTITSQ